MDKETRQILNELFTFEKAVSSLDKKLFEHFTTLYNFALGGIIFGNFFLPRNLMVDYINEWMNRVPLAFALALIIPLNRKGYIPFMVAIKCLPDDLFLNASNQPLTNLPEAFLAPYVIIDLAELLYNKLNEKGFKLDTFVKYFALFYYQHQHKILTNSNKIGFYELKKLLKLVHEFNNQEQPIVLSPKQRNRFFLDKIKEAATLEDNPLETLIQLGASKKDCFYLFGNSRVKATIERYHLFDSSKLNHQHSI